MKDLIDRQAAIDVMLMAIDDDWEPDYATDRMNELPSAQPEIIRCKDCKYYEIAWLKKDGTDDKRYKPSICVRGQYGITREPDWFCADAERRTDG